MQKSYLLFACLPWLLVRAVLSGRPPLAKEDQAFAALLLATNPRTKNKVAARMKQREGLSSSALVAAGLGMAALAGDPAGAEAAAVAAAAYAPGTVAAPEWFLPVTAAATGLLPVLMLPMLKAADKAKEAYDQENVVLSKDESLFAKESSALIVADSSVEVKGKALYATRNIPRETFLFDYTGDLLSEIEYNQRYPNRVSDYAAALRTPSKVMLFIDGRDESRGHPGRWMNHNDISPNVGRRTVFPADGSPPRILMYSLTDIRAGQELEWDYGAGYWAAHKGKVD